MTLATTHFLDEFVFVAVIALHFPVYQEDIDHLPRERSESPNAVIVHVYCLALENHFSHHIAVSTGGVIYQVSIWIVFVLLIQSERANVFAYLASHLYLNFNHIQ